MFFIQENHENSVYYICISLLGYISVHIHAYIYIHIYTCTCMYTYVYKDTHICVYMSSSLSIDR